MPAKKWIAAGLKITVSAALIWWLFGRIDVDTAMQHLTSAAPELIALSLLVLVVQITLGGLRWGAVLTAIQAPLDFATAIRLFYIGTFFNQTLPSSVGGDAVRMYMAHREGLRPRHAIAGVMLERLVTVIALVILVMAVQPWFLPKLDDAAQMLVASSIGILAIGTLIGLVVLVMLDKLPSSVERWRIGRAVIGLGGDARRVFLSPKRAAICLAYGVATHLNIGCFIYLLAMSMSIDIDLFDCLVLTPPVLLVTTLPISIAGWGVRELAMVEAFGLVAVAPEAATAISIMVGFVVLAFSIPGGLVWLASRGGDRRAAEAFAAQGGDSNDAGQDR